jgi:hypothetical protein
MPPHSATARVLVAVDLSLETDGALRCAEELRASRPVAIDVYYLWSGDEARHTDAADRAIAAVAGFARTAGAWDRLDRINALERRGLLEVPGWLTRACHGGSSLTGIAAREGYDVVVVGLERPPLSSHRFDLHRRQARAVVPLIPMLLALVLALASVACADGTDDRPRSARSPYNESTRPVGNDDVHGGSDMPGKGRGGEHDRHSILHK